MKFYILKYLVLSTLIFSVSTGCKSYISENTGDNTNDFSNGTVRMYKVSGNSITLNTENDSGKHVYMAKVNTNSQNITSQYYVSSASGLTLNTKSNPSRSIAVSTSDYSENSDAFDLYANSCRFGNLTDKVSLNLVPSTLSSARTISTSAEITYSVGDSRDLYVSDSNYTYYQKSATLKAKTDDVYVWVIDDYANPYINSTTQKEITEEIAQVYAQKMQSMYKYITAVYTNLPEKLLYSSNGLFNSESIENMSSLSKTGTKINVVITDCSMDNSASSVSGNIIGFTSSVDLMASDSGNITLSNYNYKSNIGNYFYLDNYWAAQRQDDSISTLAHEFQHLLAFGYKWLQKNLSMTNSSERIAYGEMMAMLCEDMMQDYLELDDSYTALARLPVFNSNYPYIGVLEYDSSDTKQLSYSYASAYAFGAWLVRQFGGTNLIHEMATNNSLGMTSILDAIKTVTGNNYSKSELINLYIQSLINKSADKTSPTMNQDAETGITYNSYNFPLKAINLWTLNERISPSLYINSSLSRKFDGPDYYASNQYNTLRSYGFTLHDLGTVNSDADSITLSLTIGQNNQTNTEDAEKLSYYILIQ